MERFPKKMTFHLKQEQINKSSCSDPTDCMIYHVVKETIGGHGYVKVDARGVFITRRSDYREHAILPRHVYAKMRQFDVDKSKVTPFSFTLTFHKTSKIHRYTKEEIAQREKTRKVLRKAGKIKKYDPSERYKGVAFSEAHDLRGV